MIRTIAIAGMGALGLMYGQYLAEHNPGDLSICYVMDAARAERNRRQTYTVNGTQVKLPCVTAEEAEPVDLLIIAVKYTGLEAVLPTVRNCVGTDTIIMSVMNGISSEDRIAEYFARPVDLYTVPQGMDAMRFGCELRYTQMGALHIGVPAGCDTDALESVETLFRRTGMPYVREADIMYRMWFKFMLNVGVNQTCMVYNTTYSGVINPGEPHDMLLAAMDEVRLLANAKGIALTKQDMQTCIDIEATLDPEGTPSMGQDRINRRHSEVEMFAGTVIRLAAEYGIPTPANEFLRKSVYEIESEY